MERCPVWLRWLLAYAGCLNGAKVLPSISKVLKLSDNRRVRKQFQMSLLLSPPAYKIRTNWSFFLQNEAKRKLWFFQFSSVWGFSLSRNPSAPMSSSVLCYRITYRITQESSHPSYVQVSLVVDVFLLSGNPYLMPKAIKNLVLRVLTQGVLRAGSQDWSAVWRQTRAQRLENTSAASCWNALIFVLVGRSYQGSTLLIKTFKSILRFISTCRLY